MTTVQLLLAALRDEAGDAGLEKLRDKVNGQFLINTFEENDERLKMMPTQDDRAAFRSIIAGQGASGSLLADAHRFFRNRLRALKGDGKQLEGMLSAVVERLSLVSITCEPQDNPHLIFESLNAKGEKLTPADLIRNFLLMRVHVKDQEQVFNQYWLPIQRVLGESLTEFVRHFLMKGGKILREADVYFELKDRLESADSPGAEAFLSDLHRHGMFYSRFVDPALEADGGIGAALGRLRRLEFTVAYPLLLRVFDAREAGTLSAEQVAGALDVLESFLIRRSICGLPSNQLRRMLPPVFGAVGGAGEEFIPRLRKELGGNRCPDDASFAAALRTSPLYANGKKSARLRVILDRLEQSYGHKEPANLDDAQIEHVMPQTLTPAWEAELGADARQHWARLLHTLGNLTLTGYNPEMGNESYKQKRDSLKESHFSLNSHFAGVEHWDAGAIVARGAALAERALTIWRDLARGDEPLPVGPRPRPAPVATRFRDDTWPVTTWKEAAMGLIERFESEKPGLLGRLVGEGRLTHVLSADPGRFSHSRGEAGGVYVQTHGSAKALRDYVDRIAKEGGFDEADYEFILAN